MKKFEIRLTDGTPTDVEAERFYIDGGDLVFTIGPNNTMAFAKGSWVVVREIK